MTKYVFTSEEQYKFDVITQVLKKEIKPGLAAKLLGISPRQIRRLRKRVKKEGIQAVTHGLKGKIGNHKIILSVKEEAVSFIEKYYPDFKPTFATEKLSENHGIKVSYGTTRLWMIEKGLWETKKHKNKGEYRSWRPRKEYLGELQQFDGSYHLWFENRFVDEKGNPVEVCLLAAIDDATGKITKATFAANEGVHAVFTFWKEYVEDEKLGKPLSIYLDKFSTYKINHKAAVDNLELMTQFERAMRDLDIRLISAHSPQAKGRIERLFKTLQDRLVKELRLAKINTPKEANIFLKEIFIPKFNDKFSVKPAKEDNIHRELSETDKTNLNSIFSVQENRIINNDFTIHFKNNWYQLTEIQPITIRAREKIIVEKWLDDSLHFSLKGKYLTYLLLQERPEKLKRNPLILTTHKINWKPPIHHPWRKPFKQKS